MGTGDRDPIVAAFAHCEATVRSVDPDRAVALLFAPAEARAAMSALYAFDIEAASVRRRVTQPMLGEIRLQWWRDRIETAGTVEPQDEGAPVAAALLETIRRHDLPSAAFDRLLEARVFDLYDDPMPSREAFEAYAGATSSSVIMLAAMILDRSAAPQAADAAGHAGVAELAASALSGETGRAGVIVPGDILAAAGLDREGWVAGGEGAAAGRAAMIAYAAEHDAKVRAAWRAVPRRLRPAFLPSRLVRARLSKGGSVGPLRRSWIYWRAMRAPGAGP